MAFIYLLLSCILLFSFVGEAGFAIFSRKARYYAFAMAALLLMSTVKSSAQDSCHLQVSLLTVTPGEELYSTFGHSAIRIHDTVTHQDIVYNYGTFNFDDPDFYMKFTRGKLLYYVSSDDFDSFLNDTRDEQRGITEQTLNLSCDQKRNLIMLLETNMMGANRFYKYDFLFDNCTTRLRDLIEKSTDSAVHFGRVLHSRTSFRFLIHQYLNRSDKQWSKLGIDILLGSKTDKAASPYQVMFLPDYLMMTLDSSTLAGKPLVAEKTVIVRQGFRKPDKNNLLHPFFIFLCLFVIVAFLSFSKNTGVQKTLQSFDGLLYFLTGLLGLLILFMWFGTDHIMCRDNFNVLWAWPTNVVAAFYVHSQRNRAKIYVGIYSICMLLLLLCWKLLPQQLNLALLPVIGILIFRGLLCIFRKK